MGFLKKLKSADWNRARILLLVAMFHGTASCKPKNSYGKTKAITSEDGQKSFALIPIRMKLTADWETQLSKNPISMSLVQGLRFGVYVCTGPNAEPEAMLLEAAYESSGEALRRDGREILNHLSMVKASSTCKLEGDFLAGPKVLAKMVTDTPSPATQAVYLALRGPTTLNHQTPGARFYDALTELFSVEFVNISRFVEASRVLDTLYNPCVEDEGIFAKNKKFECKNSGSYKVRGSYDELKKEVISYIKTTESEFVLSQKSTQSYAASLYQSTVDLKWSGNRNLKIDDSQFKKASGNVFSPDRGSVGTALGVELATLPNAPMTVSSAWNMETPDSKNPKWRKIGEDRFTKDDISFFSKDANSGKWIRTVLTSAYEYLTPVEESAESRVFTFVKKTPTGFGLTEPKETASTTKPEFSKGNPTKIEPKNPTSKNIDVQEGMTKPNPKGKEQWIAEQGPKMQAAVEEYRSGKIDGEKFREKMTEITKQMPYGNRPIENRDYQSESQKKKVEEIAEKYKNKEITSEEAKKLEKENHDSWREDPFSDRHNCSDISSAVCRSMYPLMPTDTNVGKVSVQAKEGTGGKDKFHSINYFKIDGKFVVYDQQSGAMSLPYSTPDEAMKDPKFSEKMKSSYPNEPVYEINYDGNEVDASKASILPWGNNGGETYQKGRFTPIAPFKGNNGKFHTIQSMPVDFLKFLKNGGEMDQVLKDGTNGKHDPDKMEWYVPDDNPRKPK